MEHRDARNLSGPPVVVVIDELVDLVMTDVRANGGTTVEESLIRLTQRGREAGIHIVAATQKPTASVISGLIKANFPVRITGRVAGAYDAYVATDQRGTGAERLENPGDFILVEGGRIHRFTAAYISSKKTEKFLREKGWWREHPPTLQPPQRVELNSTSLLTAGGTIQPAARRVETAQAQPETTDTIEEMVEKLRPWWVENRGRWGAKSEAVAQLFGPDASPEGYWWRRTMEVIERIEQEQAVEA